MGANRGDYRGLGEAIEERFRFSFSVTLSARGVVKLTGHSRRDVFRWVSALVVGGGGGVKEGPSIVFGCCFGARLLPPVP